MSRPLILVLFAVAACTGPSPVAVGSTRTPPPSLGSASASVQPSPSPSTGSQPRTPSAECISPTADLLDLIFQTDALACYGGEDLTLEAIVSGLGAVEGCGGIEPGWFGCDGMVELTLPQTAGRTGVVLAARGGGPSLTAGLHPDIGIDMVDLTADVQRITGHYDDPAALTCHPIDAEPSAGKATAILRCRSTFVIVALEPSGG